MHKSVLAALTNIDWQQVVQNGGPPCFCIEDSKFCLRALRWDGHGKFHAYVSLADFVLSQSVPECPWCADGTPEWSPEAEVWIHRRKRLDRRCLNPPKERPT